MDFKEELEIILNRMGEEPRSFSTIHKYFKINSPVLFWEWKNDEIATTIYNWRKVFEKGKIAWGHVIQANSYLFENGIQSHPGEMLVCTKHTDPDSLSHICHKLFGLKGQFEKLEYDDEKYFASYLENELKRVYGLNVPKSFGLDDNFFVSTVCFQRKHIPTRKIDNGFFPVLYLDSNPKVVVVIPFKYWSDNLIRWWKEN